MKAKFSKPVLVDALGLVGRAVSTRSAIPALSGILLDLRNGDAVLSATDMEMGISSRTSAAVEEEGVVLLPGRLFGEVARSLPSDVVDFSATPAEASIKSGTADFRLRTLNADEFPSLPEKTDGDAVSLPGGQFCQTIARVVRSASRDEARPILTGICVGARDDRLVMVASDSYRLAVKLTTLEHPIEGSFDAVVPARAIQEVARAAQSADSETIRISAAGSQAVFDVGDVRLSSRLIEGQFPDYEQLIPDAFEHEVIVGGSELLNVLRRVSLVGHKDATVKFTIAPGELTLSASAADIGESHESIPIRYEGPGLEVGFNPTFMRDGIESAGLGDLNVRLINAVRAATIEPVVGDGFVYLIMPIRLDA